MVGDKTLFDFLFQYVVMVQPMIWIILYNTEIYLKYQQERILKYGFYLLMEAVLFAVIIKKIHVGFYTTSILAQYVVLITVSFYMYSQRKHVKDAIALAFLTVFLNSLYWELPLHLAEIIKYGLYSGQIVQFWRLLPVMFLVKKFDFAKEQKRLVIIGFVFSVCMVLLRITAYRGMDGRPIFAVIRLVCLFILTKTVIEAEPKPLNTKELNK